MTRRLVAAAAIAFVATACETNPPQQVLPTEQSQLGLHALQQRAFDTTDDISTLRAIISTLQDLGFAIDRADADLSTISATKLNHYRMRMTVSARPYGQTQMLVRANAEYNYAAVDEPEPYQKFFAALERSMVMTAHKVD